MKQVSPATLQGPAFALASPIARQRPHARQPAQAPAAGRMSGQEPDRTPFPSAAVVSLARDVPAADDAPAIRDAIVIGGGPAGSQCALWLTRLGIDVVLCEEGIIGGLQALSPFTNAWLAPLPGDIPASRIAAAIRANLAAQNVEVLRGKAVSVRTVKAPAVAPADGPTRAFPWLAKRPGLFEVQCENHRFLARTVVLATGTRPRTCGLENDHILAGLHQVEPAARSTTSGGSGQSAPDRRLRIAIMGGGDAAFEAWLVLSRQGFDATIFARTIRARRRFIEQVPRQNVLVGGFEIDAAARRVTAITPGRPEERRAIFAFDRVHVLWGWEPVLDVLRTGPQGLSPRRGPSGKLVVDGEGMTTVPGLFAAGDLIHGAHPCVATALGSGSQAAKGVEKWLDASRGAASAAS